MKEKMKTNLKNTKLFNFKNKIPMLSIKQITEKHMSNEKNNMKIIENECDEIKEHVSKKRKIQKEIKTESVILSFECSREGNEDTHLDEFEIQLKNGKKIRISGIFDGHGGLEVSELCEKKSKEYIEEAIENEEIQENLCSSEKNLRLIGISKTFDNVITRLNKDVMFLKSGSTALYVIETDEEIYAHQIGDCRMTMCNEDGSIVETERSRIDNALDNGKIIEMNYGKMQTNIHCMEGLAEARSGEEDEPRSKKEDMMKWKIKGDDNEETNHQEWMTYNIAFHKGNENLKAIMPKKDMFGPGIRLSPCGTQPTRGIAGISEQTLKKGETIRYGIKKEERIGKTLVMSCDGVEDNGSIKKNEISSVIASYENLKKMVMGENLVARSLKKKGVKEEDCKNIKERMCWIERNVYKLGIDEYWKKSLKKSCGKIKYMCEDQEEMERIWCSKEKHDIIKKIEIIIEMINIMGSADNVSIGLKVYY